MVNFIGKTDSKDLLETFRRSRILASTILPRVAR